jgi:glycosyltransferase involved in cell wall biosynthesis
MTGRLLPKVTIGIPTYRRPEMLRRTLAGVALQDYEPLEVIVADNATEGGEVDAVIADFRGRIPGLRYVRHETNIGSVRNFQFCLDQASGEFFMWLADDDEIAPRSVPVLAGMLAGDPTIVSAVPYWRLMTSPDEGCVVEQRVFDSHSVLRRVLAYVWYANDAFFYALHRIDTLRTCRYLRFGWPNLEIGPDASYPFLMPLVLTGRIVSTPDRRVEWINHGYTQKSYAKPDLYLRVVAKSLWRRINLQWILAAQVYERLGIAAAGIALLVGMASVVREFAAKTVRKIGRMLGVPLSSVPLAKKD